MDQAKTDAVYGHSLNLSFQPYYRIKPDNLR